MLCPHESLNHFYGAFLLGFLWPVIWTCLVLSPILVYSWSSHVWTCISQPRWIPARKPVTNLDITPLSTSKELSSWEGLLDFENEKYVVFYLFIWSGLSFLSIVPLLIMLEFLSTGNDLHLLTLEWGGKDIYLLSQPQFQVNLKFSYSRANYCFSWECVCKDFFL